MNYIKIFLIFLIIFLFSQYSTGAELDLDTEVLQQMLQDRPNDNRLRSVLLKRYISENNFTEAKNIIPINEVKGEDAESLIKLIERVDSLEIAYNLLDKYNLALPLEGQSDINLLLEIYQNSNQEYMDILSYSYFFDETITAELVFLYVELLSASNQYQRVLEILGPDTPYADINLLQVRLEACYQQQHASCVNRDLPLLWKELPSLETGHRLVESQISQQLLIGAMNTVFEMEGLWPNETIVKQDAENISNIQRIQSEELISNYVDFPTNEQALVSSNQLIQIGLNDEALIMLELHLIEQGSSDIVQRQLATLLQQSGEYERSIELFSSLQNFSESDELSNAKSLAWNGQESGALSLFEKLLAESDNPEILQQSTLMLGYLHLWKGENENASFYFQQVEMATLPVVDQLSLQEAIYRAEEEYTLLLSSLELRLVQQPYDSSIILELAQTYVQANLEENAIESFQEYISLTDDINAHLSLGQLYIRGGKNNLGLTHLAYYAYQKNDAPAFFMLAQNYHWLQQDDDANEVLTSLLEVYPGYSQAIVLKNELTLNQNLFSRLSIDQQEKYNIAEEFYSKGDYQQAAPLFQRILQAFPDLHEIRERYAFSLENLLEYSKAAEQYEKLSLLFPERNDLLMHLGFTTGRSGNVESAERILNQLLISIKPSLPATAELLDWLDMWIFDWSTRDISRYQVYYDQQFQQSESWINAKVQNFSASNSVNVSISNPVYREIINDGDLQVIDLIFQQDYSSDQLVDSGFKTLRLHCITNNCIIHDESWHALQSDYQTEIYQANQQRQLINNELQYYARMALPINNDRTINGIILAAGITKTLEPEEEVLVTGYFEPLTLAANSSAFVRGMPVEPVLPEPIRVGLRSDYFSDTDDVDFYHTQVTFALPSGIRASAGQYQFYSPQCGNHSNSTIEVNTEIAGFEVGAYLDQLDERTVLSPSIQKTFANNISLGIAARPIFFDKLSCDSLIEEIQKYNLSYSHFLALNGDKSFWYAADVGVINDGNRDLTAQFDYRMGMYRGEKITAEWFASGWYLWNKTQVNEYYSPEFSDSTMINMLVSSQLTEKLNIALSIGSGYTFEDQQILYDYGIQINYKPSPKINSQLECEESNTSRSRFGANYSSLECLIYAEFLWQ